VPDGDVLRMNEDLGHVIRRPPEQLLEGSLE